MPQLLVLETDNRNFGQLLLICKIDTIQQFMHSKHDTFQYRLHKQYSQVSTWTQFSSCLNTATLTTVDL